MGMMPPRPVTESVRLAGSRGSVAMVTAKPRRRRQSVMAMVSSLQRAPRSSTVPEERAARTRARLVMLLEPGMTTSERGGRAGGTISISVGSMGWGFCKPRGRGAASRESGNFRFVVRVRRQEDRPLALQSAAAALRRAST